MTLKTALLSFCLLLTINYSHAQVDQSSKILNHEVGFQANQLIHQFLNFSDDDVFVSNPYLLTYSVFGNKCKWGIQLGGGYFYNRMEDKYTAANHESKFNDFAYRAGIARYAGFGKRWYGTIGLDFAGRYIENKTVAF